MTDGIKNERRRYARIHFFEQDGVRVIVSGPDRQMFPATILDIGEDGLGLALPPDDFSIRLQEGDLVTIREIEVSDAWQFLTDLEMEVKWTFHDNCFVLGCEFLQIPPMLVEQLQQIRSKSQNGVKE
jgi:c-di-GMP-binding flagellar brake protein YcgR